MAGRNRVMRLQRPPHVLVRRSRQLVIFARKRP
jgi:hypothetical protein